MNEILAPGAGYSTFRDLFLPRVDQRVRLSVPDYQRAYDWRAQQRKDLFEDLERLSVLADSGRLKERGGHFCGTIICTPSSLDPSDLRYDVVDGQQRLTTLVLLHSRLAQAAGVDPFVMSGPNTLFLPQSTDQDFFRHVALHGDRGNADTVGQQHYLDAVTEIDKWMSTLGDVGTLHNMVQLIETRLQFIFFVLPSDDEVSKVFETINNRGKPLTQLDLVKNHLIYVQGLHGWDGNVNAAWAKIQQYALETEFRPGSESVDTVLRAVVAAMFQPGRRKTGETDHSIIKQHICQKKHDEEFRRFLRFLDVGFRTFRDIRSARSTGKDDPIGTQLTYLNHHPSISGVLPLILTREYCRTDRQSAEVLEAIEKANFRLYGLLNAAKRSDSHHIALHTLAHEYFKEYCKNELVSPRGEELNNPNSLIARLTGIVTNLHKDGFGQIVKALTLDDDDGTDFYTWDALRYFLARWEDSLLEKQSFEYGRLDRSYRHSHSNDYLAREHIYPKSSKGALVEYRDRLLLRRLGNFMLLPQGVNNSLNDRSPTSKLSALAEHGLQNSLLVQNKQLAGFHEDAIKFRVHLEERNDQDFGSTRQRRFNAQTREPNRVVAEAKTLCDLREEEMVRFALSAWRMPGETLGDKEDERFLGMFSFRFEDETYLSNLERPSTKETENYIIKQVFGADSGKHHLDGLEKRLMLRNAFLNRVFVPVSWKEERDEEQRAA